jgi:hypothetical protein
MIPARLTQSGAKALGVRPDLRVRLGNPTLTTLGGNIVVVYGYVVSGFSRLGGFISSGHAVPVGSVWVPAGPGLGPIPQVTEAAPGTLIPVEVSSDEITAFVRSRPDIWPRGASFARGCVQLPGDAVGDPTTLPVDLDGATLRVRPVQP